MNGWKSIVRGAALGALLTLAGNFSAGAQDYNWGIGLRGGGVSSGITAKYFVSGVDAVEGMLSFTHGVNVYALYERHVPVIENGFAFYYGAGANIGSWEKHDRSKFTMGIDGVIGLEYKIPAVPLSLAVDYRPCINFIGHTGFKWYDFGFAARVAF